MVTEKDTRISHSAWQHGTQWINGRNWSCWPQQIQKKGALVQNLLRNPRSSGKPQRCIWALAKKKTIRNTVVFDKHKQSTVWVSAEAQREFPSTEDCCPFVYLGISSGCQTCSAHRQSGRSDCAGSGVVCLLLLPQGPGSHPGSPSGDPPSRDGCQ